MKRKIILTVLTQTHVEDDYRLDAIESPNWSGPFYIATIIVPPPKNLRCANKLYLFTVLWIRSETCRMFDTFGEKYVAYFLSP